MLQKIKKNNQIKWLLILLLSIAIIATLAIILIIGSPQDYNKKYYKQADGTVIEEISIEHLYQNMIIDIAKLMSDDSYYLKTDKILENVLYLKRGQENSPFSLNIEDLTIETVSKEKWGKASDEVKNLIFNPGDFIIREDYLINLFSQDKIDPAGDNILYFSISPTEKLIFIYSFSGDYQKPKGIGFWSSYSKESGINFLEIWNLESKKRVFYDKKSSFSKDYYPNLLFWLENKQSMIFSNRNNKYLIFIKY